MGKRVDGIVLYQNIVFVLEFKCGSEHYYSGDYDQVYDYALDLKNFHEESRDKLIIPILIATEAPSIQKNIKIESGVAEPLKCNSFEIGKLIEEISSRYSQLSFSYEDWIDSAYRPTPTIVEAAQALYTDHDVEDITRNDAGAKNITVTTDAINKIIDESKRTVESLFALLRAFPARARRWSGSI